LENIYRRIYIYKQRDQLLDEQMIGEYNQILKIIIDKFQTNTHSLCINKLIITLVAISGRSSVLLPEMLQKPNFITLKNIIF
jgi:hypothetical protein